MSTKNRKGRKILKPLVLILAGAIGGYLYSASSRPETHGHIMVYNDFEGNPHYEVMLFEEEKFPDIPSLRSRRLIDKDDEDFEHYYPIKDMVELK